jgi:hypothetical protein
MKGETHRAGNATCSGRLHSYISDPWTPENLFVTAAGSRGLGLSCGDERWRSDVGILHVVHARAQLPRAVWVGRDTSRVRPGSAIARVTECAIAATARPSAARGRERGGLYRGHDISGPRQRAWRKRRAMSSDHQVGS